MPRKISFLLAVIGLLIFVVVGGVLLFPWFEFARGRWQVEQFMKTCPVNELRIEHFAESNQPFFWTDADYQTIRVDLSTGEVAYQNYRSIPFDGFNAMTPFPLRPAAYDASQVADIKSKLVMLLPPHDSSNASYRYQVHLAFWRDNRLLVRSYAQGDRPKLRALATALGVEHGFDARDR